MCTSVSLVCPALVVRCVSLGLLLVMLVVCLLCRQRRLIALKTSCVCGVQVLISGRKVSVMQRCDRTIVLRRGLRLVN